MMLPPPRTHGTTHDTSCQSDNQEARLQNVFKSLDRDGNGKLDVVEMQARDCTRLETLT